MSFRSRLTAVLAVGLGVILVVSAVWAEKPKAVKESAAKAAKQAQSAKAGEGAESNPAVPHIAHVRLEGRIEEGPPQFALFGDDRSRAMLSDWLQRLAAARNDPKITAVALEIDAPEMSWAQAQELAGAVKRLDAAKPVYAMLTSGGLEEYIVASSARKVAMDPAGELYLVGLASEMLFFRGTLDLIGVQPQMVQIGDYKGASEPMAASQPSEPLKGEINKILDDLYEQLCGQIARQRDLPLAAAKQAIDDGPLDADEALKHKLVDCLVEQVEWESKVVDEFCPGAEDYVWEADYGDGHRSSLDMSNPLSLLGALLRQRGQEIKSPAVAVIYADGVIVMGESGEGFWGDRMAGAKTLVDAFANVADDDRIKAVVFRIDSPGGSALASELIYQAVRDCAAVKPVIASIAQTGASGGYYVALGANKILADGVGIVGSVGVVSGKLAVTGLLDKIGVTTYSATRGANAGLELERPWTDRELAVIRKLAQKTYDQFVSRVKESRGERIKDIDGVTQGRIFTARQAAENGLIDSVGGLREAVAIARKEAGIKDSHLIHLPRPKTLADILMDRRGTLSPIGAIAPGVSLERTLISRLVQSRGAAYVLSLCELWSRERTLMAMPYYLSIR